MLQLFAKEDEAPYFAALEQARDKGWLAELMLNLIAAKAMAGFEASAQSELPIHQDMQGIVRPLLGYIPVSGLHAGVLTAMRRVCRIAITTGSGYSTGSGFLVGPQAVITAWHVVRPLLDQKNEPVLGSCKNISIEFDELDGASGGTRVGVVESWLIDARPYHPSEHPPAQIPDFTGPDPGDFDKYLDFAVIRLAIPVGRERGFYRLDQGRRPSLAAANAQITLFQHPEGAHMHVAVGANRALWPPVFETRLHHDANSNPGTSGGLVADCNFEPIAIHQCGFHNAAGNTFINGAIPTACIAKIAKSFDNVVGPDPLWQITATGEPVIGREKFQAAVMQCLSGDRRILVVNGEPKTGRSFSIKLLRALLGVAEHAVVEFPAADLSATPEKLAVQLLEKFEMPAGANQPLPSSGEADTAREAWIRDILYPAFAQRLRAGSGGRITWLVIDDLDVNAIPNTASRHLLERLYQEIASFPNLRIVLIGLGGVVPGAAPNHVIRDETQPFTIDDIQKYIDRYLAHTNETRSNKEVKTLASFVMQAATFLPGSRMSAMAQLVSAPLLAAIQEGRGT
ncbi:serine protease [Cupriavidus sp. L7L]|uniref:serine protease n=1 Tax=Cupriavidus sp. L7L TaxID=2546443 RepID=UPI001FB5AE6B|nr:serine protease [Cupriavidus sp. L7L]